MSVVTKYVETPHHTVNNHLTRTGFDKDYLYRATGKAAFTGETRNMEWDKRAGGLRMVQPAGRKARSCTARYTSPVIWCRFPATEFLPSWNILLPRPGQGFQVFVRVYAAEGARPSRWFYAGEAGEGINTAPVKMEVPAWGRTRIDYLELKRPATAFQYRIDMTASHPQDVLDGNGPVFRRFFMHYSGQSAKAPSQTGGKVQASRSVIPVPYRSQLTVSAVKLRNVICCPTSLSMVLEHNGVDKPTLDICQQAFDKRHQIYGVWPQVVHVASQYGFESWIHRFRSHADVLTYLNQGLPIIASIRVPEGQLRGARYGKSNGHIIVITGIRKNGRYVVNDPASHGDGGEAIDYFAEDMEKVWLDKGGVGIIVKSENTK